MRLKELRKKQNLNQNEIARYLNVQQSTYSGYESGTYEPTIETLKKLADFYHTSVDYIIGRPIDQINLETIKPIKKKLIQYILRMNELEEIKAEAYLDGLMEE